MRVSHSRIGARTITGPLPSAALSTISPSKMKMARSSAFLLELTQVYPTGSFISTTMTFSHPSPMAIGTEETNQSSTHFKAGYTKVPSSSGENRRKTLFRSGMIVSLESSRRSQSTITLSITQTTWVGGCRIHGVCHGEGNG